MGDNNKKMGSGSRSNPGHMRDLDEQSRNRNSARGSMASKNMGPASGNRGTSASGRTQGSSSGRSDRDSSRGRDSREDEDPSE
jgi:hypothetical protein